MAQREQQPAAQADEPATGNWDLVILWVAFAIFVAGAGVILIGYVAHWEWTGAVPYNLIKHPAPKQDPHVQPGKTVWDWLQLLVIPVAVAAAVAAFNRRQKIYEIRIAQRNRENDLTIARDNRANDLKIAQDNRANDLDIARTNRENDLEIARERLSDAVLEGYLTQMAALMLDTAHALATSATNSPVRHVAEGLTVSTLRRLQGDRKGIVIWFLYRSGLVAKTDPRVELTRADLTGVVLDDLKLTDIALAGANLSRASLNATDLSGANLAGARMSSADLKGALLVNAIVTGADLGKDIEAEFGTNLESANLHGANLEGADLVDAILSSADLSNAKLARATLDGADLTGADLTGAVLDQATISQGALTPEQLDSVASRADIKLVARPVV